MVKKILFFSLPTQRCFLISSHSAVATPLFSAYAEVFPSPNVLKLQVKSFLCLRRGVSQWLSIKV